MADYITKGSFNLGNQITLKNKNSNIDRDYGPYEGKTLEEIAALLTDTIQIGKTIGVIESGNIVEYWWQQEGDGYAFVKKGESKEIIVDSELSLTSTNPIQNQAVAKALGGKADSSTVSSINTRVGTLETTITSKADKSDLDSLQTAVESINTSIPMVVVNGNEYGDFYIKSNEYSILAGNFAEYITIWKEYAEIEGAVNHYMIRFTYESEDVSVHFADWKFQWAGGNEPEWEIGKTYEVSIIDNIALWAEIG